MKAVHRHAWRVALAAMKSLASVTSTTLITVTAFILSSVIGPVAHAAALPTPGVAQAVRASLGSFQMPASVGRITDAQYFGSNKVVVAVQDLHCQPDVQRNIARVLGIIEEQWGRSAGMNVFVEGGIGTVNTSWVDKFSDERERHEIVETLLSSGRLTGAEYYAVQTGRHTLLHGLEDRGLYFDNLTRLNNIMDIRADIAENMRAIDEAFARVRQTYYTAGNIRLDRLEARYRAGTLKDVRYYRTLLKMAEHQRIDIRNFPSILTFLEVSDYQRGLRARAISRELVRFIATLKQQLPFDVYSRLMQQSARPGGIDEVCMTLARVAPGMDLRPYPALAKYFTFIERNGTLNPLTLVREERALRGELRAVLSRSHAEREVAFLADFLDVTRAYYENRASAEEYAYYSKHTPAFRRIWERYSQPDLLPALDAYTELFARYYQVNVERNRVFMAKIGAGAAPLKSSPVERPVEESMRLLQDQLSGERNSATVSVVVTGGFHTQGMADMLRAAGISYVVVTPHVSGSTAFAQRMYDIFARESVHETGAAPAVVSSAVSGPDQSALALYAESLHFADMTAAQIRQCAIDVQLQSAVVSAALAHMSAPHIAEQLLQSGSLREKFKDITADGTAVTFHFADGHRISVNVADDAEHAVVTVHKPGSGPQPAVKPRPGGSAPTGRLSNKIKQAVAGALLIAMTLTGCASLPWIPTPPAASQTVPVPAVAQPQVIAEMVPFLSEPIFTVGVYTIANMEVFGNTQGDPLLNPANTLLATWNYTKGVSQDIDKMNYWSVSNWVKNGKLLYQRGSLDLSNPGPENCVVRFAIAGTGNMVVVFDDLIHEKFEVPINLANEGWNIVTLPIDSYIRQGIAPKGFFWSQTQLRFVLASKTGRMLFRDLQVLDVKDYRAQGVSTFVFRGGANKDGSSITPNDAPGNDDGNAFPALDSLDRRVPGNAPAGTLSFTGINDPLSPQTIAAWNVLAERGQIPYETLEIGSIADINSGVFDDLLRARARAVAQYGKPLLLRYFHELNGNWYPWSVKNESDITAFVSAWKRVADIYYQEGATNVRFVFSPHSNDPAKGEWEYQYVERILAALTKNQPRPYVHIIGLDAYSYPPSGGNLREMIAELYLRMSQFGLPIMMGETSSAMSEAEKNAFWSGFMSDLRNGMYPQMVAVGIFNTAKEEDGWKDFTLPLNIAQQMAQDPFFKSRSIRTLLWGTNQQSQSPTIPPTDGSANTQTITAVQYVAAADWKTASFDAGNIFAKAGQTIYVRFQVKPGLRVGYNFVMNGKGDERNWQYSGIADSGEDGVVILAVLARTDTTISKIDLAVGKKFFKDDLNDSNDGSITDNTIQVSFKPLTLPSTYRIGRWFIKMIGKDAAWSEEKKIQFIEQRLAPLYFPDIIMHTVLLMVGKGQPNRYRILGAASIWTATFLAYAVVGMIVPGIHYGLAIAIAAAVNAATHAHYNKKFGSYGFARSPLTSDDDGKDFLGPILVLSPFVLVMMLGASRELNDTLTKFLPLAVVLLIGGTISTAVIVILFKFISGVVSKLTRIMNVRADNKRRAALINTVSKMLSLEQYDMAKTFFQGQLWKGRHVDVTVNAVLDAMQNIDSAVPFVEMLMNDAAFPAIRRQALDASVRFPQEERLADALIAAAKDDSAPAVQKSALAHISGGVFHYFPQMQQAERHALETLVSHRDRLIETLSTIPPKLYEDVLIGYDDSNYLPNYYTDGLPAGELKEIWGIKESPNPEYGSKKYEINEIEKQIICLQKLEDGTGQIAAGLSAEELIAERSRIRSGSDNVAARHREAVSAVWQTLNDIVRDERQSAAVRATAVRTQFHLEPVQWMVSRVYDEEQYLLGHELTFAVDIVERILRVQDSSRRQVLLREYVLHELMESDRVTNTAGRVLEGKEKHDRIISLTAERHEGRNGTTVLGQFLRGFIDERAASMRAVLDRFRRFILPQGPLDIPALRRAASEIAVQPVDYFPALRGMHVVIVPRITEQQTGDAVRRANATGEHIVVCGARESSAAGEYTAIPGTDLARLVAETTSGSVTIISYPRGSSPDAALMQQSLDAAARLLRGEWLARAREDARLSRFMKFSVEPSIAVIELGGRSFSLDTLDLLANPSPHRPVIVAGASGADAREAFYDGALWEASSDGDYLSQLQYLNDRAVRATTSYTAPLPGIAAISPVRIRSVEDINRLDNPALMNTWRAGQIDTVLFEIAPAAGNDPSVLSRLHGLGDTLRLNGIRMGLFVDINGEQAPAPAWFHAMASTVGGGFGTEVVYVRNVGSEHTPASADYIRAVQKQVLSANPDAVVLVEGMGADDSSVVSADLQAAPRFILATPDNMQENHADAARQARMIVLDRQMTDELQRQSIADVPEDSARNVWLRFAARFREARMQDPAWRYEQGRSDGWRGTPDLKRDELAALVDGVNMAAVTGDAEAAAILRRALRDYRAGTAGSERMVADHFQLTLRGTPAEADYLMGCVAGLLEHAFSRETVMHDGKAVPLTLAMMQLYGKARVEQWLLGADIQVSGDPLTALHDSPIPLLRDAVISLDPAAMTPAQLEGAAVAAINTLMVFARATEDPAQQQIALAGSIELLRLYGEREIPKTLVERTGDMLKTELLRSMLGAA